MKWSGQAWMTSLSADTPNEDSSTWSASFSGNRSINTSSSIVGPRGIPFLFSFLREQIG